MLNGTWPQIHQIKIHQFQKFSNSLNFTPSKISRYTVYGEYSALIDYIVYVGLHVYTVCTNKQWIGPLPVSVIPTVNSFLNTSATT